MTAPQTTATNNSQSMIAELRRERDAALAREAALAETLATRTGELAQRTAELATRNSEYHERIEQQSATIDVLKVMSASPGDPQPVFDLIVQRARDLCDAYGVTVTEFDGTLLHHRASTGISDDPKDFAAVVASFPMPPTRDILAGRAILDRRIIRINDLQSEQDLHPMYRHFTAKSTVLIPLMRDDEAIGALGLGSRERGGFSDSQIGLLTTFAEQAVIAIGSAETYRTLQTRTADLQESLEYQTATSEVLKVISRSTFDLQPVLDTVAETAARLCDADQAAIYRREGDSFQLVTNCGWPPEYEARQREVGRYGVRATSPGIPHQAIIKRRAIHIHDVTTVPDYPEVAIKLGKERTGLGVPLLREGEPVGVIVLARQRVEPFTDRQIALVSTFADQAVIAIENTRLITEQQEALEQQTATAEVLGVINESPGNLMPVFDAVLEKSHNLCGSVLGSLLTFDGTLFTRVASHGYPAHMAEALQVPYPPQPRHEAMLRGERFVQIMDLRESGIGPNEPVSRDVTDALGLRTGLYVPLRKDGRLVGLISSYRQEVRPFSDRHIALLEGFAAQAVIAMENARLITETRDALEQQTATAEVLQVINASPGELVPVFDAILEKAHCLCGAAKGALVTFDGQHFRAVATRGLSETYAQMLREPRTTRGSLLERLLNGASFVLEDTSTSPLPLPQAANELEGVRTVLLVPLRRDGTLLGYITIYSQEVRPFTEKQIALLQNFAAQAVIAMENARLLTEQREALEQQTAMAEVLQVINASPGNLKPVFEAILERAMHLCEAAFGGLWTFVGDRYVATALRGVPDAYLEFSAKHTELPGPGSAPYRYLHGERSVLQNIDMADDEVYRSGNVPRRGLVDIGGARTALHVPLRTKAALGVLTLYRKEVRPFTDKQAALLENFAAQAVIAMENARLLNEIRQRQAELRTTFDNMGDGVAMFDTDLRLAAWNRNFQRIIDLPDTFLETRPSYADYLRLLAERGEFGTGDVEAELNLRIEDTEKELRLERARPDGRVIEVRRSAVPGGGFVLIYADITERKRNEAEIRAARDAAEEASRTIEAAYRDLKAAQANLIQAEKMASLGQLTAGIAHEIKNPLNFVNNFSALSAELIDELREVLIPQTLGDTVRAEVDDLTALLKGNLEKVVQHGQRADGIVKAMLEHSRGSSAERRMVDLNALIDEALNLGYHGTRAQDQSFNISLERDFAEGIASIEVNPQDMTRVFLNIFSNGFYAATKRARSGVDAEFAPTLKVTTRDAGEAVEIRVRDNGTGIPGEIMDKLFQPFFTTKPTGEGTGLGLSITYDIVTKQHGGTIAVESEVDEFTEFAVTLPRQMFATKGGRA